MKTFKRKTAVPVMGIAVFVLRGRGNVPTCVGETEKIPVRSLIYANHSRMRGINPTNCTLKITNILHIADFGVLNYSVNFLYPFGKVIMEIFSCKSRNNSCVLPMTQFRAYNHEFFFNRLIDRNTSRC